MDQALDAARARLASQAHDEPAGERVHAPGFVRFRRGDRDERRHAFGLRTAIGGGDRGPERRLREDVGAERGEDVGGVGHARLSEANANVAGGMRGGDRQFYYQDGRFAYAVNWPFGFDARVRVRVSHRR